MDIGAWLRSLGLSRYETAFCDNSIDADVLPDLTDGDLAQLGVNLGDRKRLLKAIASLNAIDLAAKPKPTLHRGSYYTPGEAGAAGSPLPN